MDDNQDDSLSTDSNSDFEESAFPDSTPDGLRFKKKLLSLIKRVRKSRRLSTRNEKEHIANEQEGEVASSDDRVDINSADDKLNNVFQPVSAYDTGNTETHSYALSKHKRGLAVFIINSDFRHQPRRPFTKTDVYFMTKLFRHLGFEIELLENMKGHILWKELIRIQRSITEDYDCFVCVISSHGAEFPLSRRLDPERKLRQHVIFTTDGEIPTDRILEVFSDDRCGNLTGKPRMFFIQACRCVMGADDDFDVDKGVDIDVINTTVHDQVYPILYVRRFKTRSDEGKWTENNPDYCYYSDQVYQIGCSKDGMLDPIHPDTNEKPVDFNLQVSSGRPEDSSCPDTKGRPEDSSNMHDYMREMYFRSKEPSSFCFIPCYEDFLVMFSSASERTAWSDKGKGGWLLFCLYKIFKRLLASNYKINILQILTEVSGKMSRDLRAETPSDPLRHHTKSVATIYHMLTKEIYLQPKRIPVRPVQETAV